MLLFNGKNPKTNFIHNFHMKAAKTCMKCVKYCLGSMATVCSESSFGMYILILSLHFRMVINQSEGDE